LGSHFGYPKKNKINKIFKHKSSKYKHEKKCAKLDLKIEYKKLKQELEETKQKLTSIFNPTDLVSFMTENKDIIKQPININPTNNNNTNNKTVNLAGIKYAKEYYHKAPLIINKLYSSYYTLLYYIIH